MRKIDFITDNNKGYEADLNYGTIDTFIVKVLWWHLGIFTLFVFGNAVIKIASLFPSPFAWRVISPSEAMVAMLIAVMATIIPLLLKNNIQNHYIWRIVVTIALTVYSYLFVFISGGAIEMHFHFFIIIALLVIYADWRLGWILLVLTGLHHGILNYIEPGWVYFYGRNDFSVVAHALPVLAAVIFTTILSEAHKKSVLDLRSAKIGLEKIVAERTLELKQANTLLGEQIKQKTAELEKLNVGLEEKIAERTRELQTKIAETDQMNKLMIGRELKMTELKREIEELKKKESGEVGKRMIG